MTRAMLVLIFLLLLGAEAGADSGRILDPFHAAGIDRRPGAEVPLDRPFRDETGRSATLRAFGGGRPILLVPVQHNCPNICGVTLAGLLQAIGAQDLRPGRDFTTLAFGIDPMETPGDAAGSLKRLLGEFPALPGGAVHALTGTPADIAAVTGALGYRYAWDAQLGQFDHVAAVAVLTPEGRLARWLYGVTPDPRDLKLALTEAGQGRIGTWTDQLLLFCYHYDPATGRYSSIIWILLRVLAAATVITMLALIGRSVLRERHP